ncbi:MAG: Na+/glucose cotransporter, partial [Gemmatimonadaceae bacterium]
MAALVAGFVLGMGRLLAELGKASLDGWLFAYADINFLHFAVLLFVVCTVVLVVASLSAPAPTNEQLAGITFATTEDVEPSVRGASWRRVDIVLSIVVAMLVGLEWLYFR